jgi:hypothetical protein
MRVFTHLVSVFTLLEKFLEEATIEVQGKKQLKTEKSYLKLGKSEMEIG